MADTATGVLKLDGRRGGRLRSLERSLQSRPDDPFVAPALIQKFRLAEGALVSGPVRRAKRGHEVAEIQSVGGMAPEDFAHRTPYKDLVAVDPSDRFRLAATGDESLRVVDLVAPLGRGTRSLIVSPPKAGKTVLLEKIAGAIRAESPEVRVICLLVDERPEEVTHFRRAVDAEVLASSNDQTVAEHVELTELLMAHVRTELECGRDLVVLVDSLTRMGRAFNLSSGRSGRTMSGGVEAGALEVPRRFFGLARNVEGGGSATIVATCLIDTGSRMDQVIFEEFKGTGNSELVLSRELAESYVFPAVDINASGTRKEGLLYGDDDVRKIGNMRRMLAGMKPIEAMDKLLELLRKYPTNEALLAEIPART